MSGIQLAEGVTDPKVKSGVTAYLNVDGAAKAAELYERAFGAKEVARYPLDDKGRTMHLHLYINDASVMLSDPFPEYGSPAQTPQAFTLHLQVDDVDHWWKRATDAGLQIIMPLDRMFWGDRYGQLKDSFGVMWSIGGN
ncbi:VOC family protein [Kaistia dalseonensis]|uniref:Glyoxalase superfamily protein PhnB n=1 Tax=Kaistia dalseonensis TaxID=410840 RepID=A0ABU0H2Z0_9HYPH|nr:VOC family protein [Kaistia dalseonensis]MCX5494089.1 VOC family protein [Kaistia dalseonensis]MDQ0436668.1 putative glyoxalase superfamily protein PhnB [Kaistia dalseonensis]